jgi:AraC family transcriptional regulator
MGLSGYEYEDTKRDGEITGVWIEFIAEYDKKLRDYYTEPFGQIGAITHKFVDGRKKIIIGAEYRGKMVEGLSVETIPAATWAVFSFAYPAGYTYYMDNFNKIISEWLPESEYTLDEDVMQLESYTKDIWQIWLPVIGK